MGLAELNFHGQNFTWCNNRSLVDRIYERLDRAYVTENWLHKYEGATVLNMPILVSDHSPILLLTSPITYKKKSPIKMEAWCLEFQEITSIISTHWNHTVAGSPMYKVAQKCRQVRYNMFRWSRNFKDQHNIKWEEHLNKCSNIQTSLSHNNFGHLDETTKVECLTKLQIQLKYWQQRAKSKWKAWEDTNTDIYQNTIRRLGF